MALKTDRDFPHLANSGKNEVTPEQEITIRAFVQYGMQNPEIIALMKRNVVRHMARQSVSN